MTSIIKLHAISGAMSDLSSPCYILQIDDFRFLLDCGWDEHFDMGFINEVKKYVHKIDCVLLSHSDTLGALPYLVGKCGLQCPVYASIPVFKMGQMFMYDLFLNRNNSEDFNLFNLDDVDSAFDKILQLEYNSSVGLKGRGLGISITALPAGHSLGGTVWKISKSGEQDIIYAIDHNNKKERHLNGFEIDGIRRPGIFITNAINALYVQEKRRKRDEMLMGMMQQTLRTGGNMLIATDTAGRALELILMMDQMWRMKDSGLAPYSLVFLNNVAFNVVEFAKSQVEWMSEKLIKAFESQKTNPFQLKNVILCHTLIELSQIASPKVVITSSADLECGFARDLFLQWCQDPRSSVILTHRTSPGTLGRQLADGIPRGKKMDLEIKQKVKLEGRELEEFNQRKLNDKKRKIDMISLDDSDDESEVVFSHKGGVKQSDDVLTITLGDSFKMNNNNNPSLPSENPKKRRFDDYGEIIQIEDFKENGKLKKDLPPPAKKRSMYSSCSEPLESDPPTKTVSTTQTFSINCQTLFIDFEGRSDIEALLKMLQDIQPQRLVILRGTPQATIALDNMVQKLLPKTKIYKPSLRRVINLTSSSSKIFQVKLTDSLMSSLELSKVRDCEVAWIDGELADSTAKDDNLQAETKLEPLNEPLKTPSHQPCVVNRLRISELRIHLSNNGIDCEVKNGCLHCKCSNGMVYIQKDSETHSIHIECDGISDEYYQIRTLLYDQMAML